jgi:hypothetical protein
MQNCFVRATLAGIAALVFSPVLLAQSAKQSEAATARMAGHPADLTGVWTGIRGSGRTFAEEPPMTPWAAEKYKAAREGMDPHDTQGGPLADPIITACAPGGMTRILQQGRPFEIFQVPGRVLIVFEVDSKVRHIWTDGRELPKDPDPTWMGYSVGHWDGDTLVVETIGLNDKTWLDGSGHPHSEALRVVERFRRVSKDTLEVEVTYEDPKAYTKPWRGKLTFQSKPGDQLIEWVTCDDRIQEKLKSDPCENPSWELKVLCSERKRPPQGQ